MCFAVPLEKQCYVLGSCIQEGTAVPFWVVVEADRCLTSCWPGPHHLGHCAKAANPQTLRENWRDRVLRQDPEVVELSGAVIQSFYKNG